MVLLFFLNSTWLLLFIRSPTISVELNSKSTKRCFVSSKAFCFKSAKNQPLATNSLIAKTEPEPKIFVIEPPMPLPDDWQPLKTEVVDNEDSMIASIEFKPGKPSKTFDDEIASIEFKPNQDKKRTFSEQFNKLRNSEINLPTIGDAKQNLFALLSHNK